MEGYPRWEFRYLKNELIREPTVNVSTLLLTADDGFVQDADPPVHDKDGKEVFPGPITHFPDTMQDLEKYQVLIIGDVEPTYFSPMQQSLIIDWVKTKGGGVCFIAGNQSNPELYRQTPLEVLLPVTPDEIDPRAQIVPPSDNTAFTLLLTPAGKETNLFRFFDDPEESWKQVENLPPMFWFKPVQGLKPGRSVLAMNPNRSTGGSRRRCWSCGNSARGRSCSRPTATPGAGGAIPASRSFRVTGCKSAGCCTPTRRWARACGWKCWPRPSTWKSAGRSSCR